MSEEYEARQEAISKLYSTIKAKFEEEGFLREVRAKLQTRMIALMKGGDPRRPMVVWEKSFTDESEDDQHQTCAAPVHGDVQDDVDKQLPNSSGKTKLVDPRLTLASKLIMDYFVWSGMTSSAETLMMETGIRQERPPHGTLAYPLGIATDEDKPALIDLFISFVEKQPQPKLKQEHLNLQLLFDDETDCKESDKVDMNKLKLLEVNYGSDIDLSTNDELTQEEDDYMEFRGKQYQTKLISAQSGYESSQSQELIPSQSGYGLSQSQYDFKQSQPESDYNQSQEDGNYEQFCSQSNQKNDYNSDQSNESEYFLSPEEINGLTETNPNSNPKPGLENEFLPVLNDTAVGNPSANLNKTVLEDIVDISSTSIASSISSLDSNNESEDEDEEETDSDDEDDCNTTNAEMITEEDEDSTPEDEYEEEDDENEDELQYHNLRERLTVCEGEYMKELF